MLGVDGTQALQDTAPLAFCGRPRGPHHHITSSDDRLLVSDRHCHANLKGGDGCGKANNTSGGDDGDIWGSIKNQ
jgi:hypothetical protein